MCHVSGFGVTGLVTSCIGISRLFTSCFGFRGNMAGFGVVGLVTLDPRARALAIQPRVHLARLITYTTGSLDFRLKRTTEEESGVTPDRPPQYWVSGAGVRMMLDFRFRGKDNDGFQVPW